jgi:dTDP-4-amino-4,6-dideoxygalactose transaminase
MRDHCLDRRTNHIFGWGYNSRLDNVQAAILNVKMPYLPAWIERRRYLAAIYQNRLQSLTELRLPPAPKENSSHYDVYGSYVVRTKQRNKLKKHLDKCGVETMCWKTPNHLQRDLNFFGYKLPVTERLCKETLRLPLYPEMIDEQAHYVAESIHKFYT